MTENRETQTLKRSLGLSGVVIIGIAWVTPLIVLATIGIIAQLSNGTAPTAYLVTLAAMLFTAYSYGRMASVQYRTAGSAYTYVGEEMGPRFGFLTGWLILLVLFIPLMVWLRGSADERLRTGPRHQEALPLEPRASWVRADLPVDGLLLRPFRRARDAFSIPPRLGEELQQIRFVAVS